MAAWLAVAPSFAAAPALAETDKDARELPRLGLDVGEPLVRSAPPALPFGLPPATSKEYVLDFHGYLLLPMNLGLHEREDPAPGQSELVMHTPPLVPQDYRSFEYTGVVPDPWVQLNFTYGNSVVSGTAILSASSVHDGEAVLDPVRQIGVSAAFVTLDLADAVGLPLQVRVGAMPSRYGSMGAFDAGRYATPLIARVNAVGEVATVAFPLGESSIVIEQGIGGQLGRAPYGQAPSGWNDFFGAEGAGASYVNHLHAGFAHGGLFQLGGHYLTAWSQDDQAHNYAIKDGRITVLGADARLTSRFGHLYLGAAHTKAVNSRYVSGIIEVLNARGGLGLMEEYFGEVDANGQKTDGDGSLMTFGLQYDMSLSRMLFPEDYRGKNPDVLFSLFGVGTKVSSELPDYDDVLKLKGGAEVTYNVAKWFGVSGRFDHVRLDHEFNRRSFNVYTARALFHTDWQSRDEFALQYSNFVYGREVYVDAGYPPEEDRSLNPDRHVLSLSATFWW
ncbi:MAG TPA: hypothetical protein VFZ53_29740 [Polyangiaceae bacterium]